MGKDSQLDNKKTKMKKCDYKTPITEEGHNHNPNAKHKSIEQKEPSIEHFSSSGN